MGQCVPTFTQRQETHTKRTQRDRGKQKWTVKTTADKQKVPQGKSRDKRENEERRQILSEQPQSLTINWTTNCIGFVNLTTGTSDRDPWHWLAMLCPINHNNTSPVMSQMWNNPDFLRCVWCYVNSRSKLAKVRHWPITDQMIWEKSQRADNIAPFQWVWSGEDTLVCSGFYLWQSVTDFFGWVHWEESLQSHRRKWVHFFFWQIWTKSN